jgi:1,4-alpha-glucan branching enzyme
MNTMSLVLLLLLPLPSDNNVEWNGISHVAWQDRRPICPVDGESFQVRFQAYRGDLTAARVMVDDGPLVGYAAAWLEDRGPYAVWGAAVPATSSSTLSYYLELTDGTDTDYYSVSGMSENPPTDGGFVVDYDTLSHAPLGATPVSGGGAVFRVWAPGPTAAYVAGEFNGWSTTANPMARDGDTFVARVSSAADRQMYKYVFQPGTVWKPDARGKSLNPGQYYNTHIEDAFRYEWASGDFAPPAFEDMIVYELHVGTFAGRNDPLASGAIPATYRDVAAHVDHFVELGVNVIELLPITEFPWDFSAGYNPITAWAPEWKYGDPDDLKYLIDVLHANGIAVALDIVWNHFSPSDNYLWYFDGSQIYFDSPAVDTPWGSQADFDRPEVRSYFLDSALHWLEEFRMDGFRMDATEFMDLYQGSGWELMQEFNNRIDNRWIDKIAIAEQLPDDAWVTRPTSTGGAGFDSQWHDAFTDSLRQEILDCAYGDPEMWKIRDILYGSGAYLQGRYVTNYLEAHDEIWPTNGGQRLVKTIDPTYPHDDVYAKGRIKLAQGLVFFAPGIPMIHQGSEWLEYTDFGGGDPSGADRINWALKTANAPIFRYFRDAIAVRKGNAALRASADIEVFHVNDAGNVIAFHRWDYAGNDLVVVANFSNGDYPAYQLGFPQDGTWYELLNSQASEYDGNGMGNAGSVATTGGPYDGFTQSAFLTLPQMGLLVFRYDDPPDPPECPEDLNRDGTVDLSDLAQLLGNYGMTGAVHPDGDVDGDGDVDLSDLAQLLGVYGQSCP